jgi:hypothetical protein
MYNRATRACLAIGVTLSLAAVAAVAADEDQAGHAESPPASDGTRERSRSKQ